ncbi:MAG TPA: hypothetical protein VFX15_12945, partial [Actinomycetes bacterium]|nr:hypothetical protein [Actinomycetes bacterium]
YAVGSKQAAAAATELNTLAGDLRASIAQFKTSEHHQTLDKNDVEQSGAEPNDWEWNDVEQVHS